MQLKKLAHLEREKLQSEYDEQTSIVLFPVESFSYQIEIGEDDRDYDVHVLDTANVYSEILGMWEDPFIPNDEVWGYLQGDSQYTITYSIPDSEVPATKLITPVKLVMDMRSNICGKSVVE